MKGLLTLAWFLACNPWRLWLTVYPAQASFPSRPQFPNPQGVPAASGSLLDLKFMIEEVTGKSAIADYAFYGCYCGWGGRGTPKDGTDRCCQLHDYCYERLENRSCGILTQSYKFRVSRGRVTCESGTFCQEQLCACDQKLVYCLRRNLRSYNRRYRFFPYIFCK